MARRRSRVVVDASPLLYGQTVGIARATQRLIESLLALEPEFDLTFFGRRLLGPSLAGLGLRGRTVQLRLPRSAESVIKFLGLVEASCPADLYHATDFYLPLRRPERSVATVYDVLFLTSPERMVDHARLARWVPPFARRCRRVITISEFSKSSISETLGIEPDKIDAILLATDREVFRPESDEEGLRRRLRSIHGLERPFFLAVSCSTGRKNTPMILDAYAGLLEQAPANDLALVWDAPPEIRERYGRGQLAERIHFLSRQPDSALRDLYCGATALLYPSLYEGFGLPVLEAMSCGCPVVTSNTTSLPEAGGDAALYIDPSDRTTLVAALEAFENGAVDVATMLEKGLRHAARFSWERTARETLAVYAKALGQ